MMRRVIPAVVALALVIATGLVHGYFTDRWQVNETVRQAAAGLEQMPTKVGDWESEPTKANGRARADLAAEKYVRFVNRKTGDVVSVALVCGRMGPVSIHNPDVCYSASGYTVGKKTTLALKELSGEPTFFTADMKRPNTAEGAPQRLFWAWRAAGKWQVADEPRQTFASQPVLYKFYLARELSVPVPLDQEPIVELLRQLLPELDKVLDGGA